MGDLYKWRIYCEDEDVWYYLWQTSAPVACPTIITHVVNTNSIAKFGKVRNYKTLTSTDTGFTMTGYNFYRCDTSSGNIQFKLQSAVGIKGRHIIVQKMNEDTNTVTIVPYGSETVNGSSSYILQDKIQFIKIKSDGINWVPVSIKNDEGETDGELEGNMYSQFASDGMMLYTNNDFRSLGFNFKAIAEPSSATDDTTLNYGVGSTWVDTAKDFAYICTDSTDGAAVWKKITWDAVNAASTEGNFNIFGGVIANGDDAGKYMFKSLTAGSNKLSISETNNIITLDVAPGNVSINDLSGTLAINKGGTNATSFGTTNALVYYDGTSLVNDADLTWNATTNTLTTANLVVGSNALAITTSGETQTINFNLPFDMNGKNITGLAAPSGNNDAVRKIYVDSLINASSSKLSARVVATSNIDISATIAGSTIDGVTVAAGQRVLLTNQSSGIQNGIYTVVADSAPTRVSDLALGSSASGALVYVNEGTSNSHTIWACTSLTGSDVVGTDSLAWTKISSTQVTAGNGLLDTSGTFSVKTDDTSIQLDSGNSYKLTLIGKPTTKGDLFTHNGSAQTSLGVGTNGYILSANSSASTGLEWVPSPTFSTTIYYAVVYDSKTLSSNGGQATASSWYDRELNTETDPNSIVSISGNAFTLAAGSYIINVSSPFNNTGNTRVRLVHGVGNTVDAESMSVRANSQSVNITLSTVVTPNASTDYKVQYICETADSNNTELGVATGLGTSEIYTTVTIMNW